MITTPNLETIASMTCLIAAGGLFVWAAVSDLKTFRISNSIPIALLFIYPIFVLVRPAAFDWITVGLACLFALAAFVAGLGLFALRVMGGGDVKLLSVGLLWTAPQHAFTFLVVTSMAGLLLALVIVAKTAVDRVSASADGGGALRGMSIMKLELPYGAAIAAGGLYVLGTTFLGLV